MVRELIDMELDAVSGGFSLPSLKLHIDQTNTVTQTATASGKGGSNNAINVIGTVGNSAEALQSFGF
jgi:hypothetical protein